MSASNSQRRDASLEGPVRIVYHAENRTFARLFNERSLGEVKDVVRRKLGLGRDTDVFLKQMGANTLLDLEDDDDFQAFCILLKSSDSVNIQVTVGRSQGAAVSAPIALSRENPSVSEPPFSSHPEGPAIPVQPEVATTSKASTATKKPRESSTRKRRVSFSGADLETPDKPAERRRRSKSTSGAAASSVETLETPATAEPTEEPPKKKHKREQSKAVESTPAEAPESPKTKVKKPAKADRKSKSASKSIETSDQPAKKPRKKKEKQPEPIETDDTDTPDRQLGNEAPLRTGKSEKLSVKSSRSKPEKEDVPTIGLCASIPQTNACTDLLSEVAAAIRNTVRGITGETFTSNTSALGSATISRTSASGISVVPTEHRLEAVVPTGRPPQQTSELNGPSCPICLEVPFHIRYCCPIVQKGSDAIRERLDELKKSNNNGQESLTKELEDLLRDSKVTSEPSASTDDVQSREVLQSPEALVSRTSNVPSNSYLSEVTVESRNEGSSSESSDDASEGEAELKGLAAYRGQETLDEQPSPPNDDLEAIIRGPRSRRQSVLGVLDRILDSGNGSESEDDTDDLEGDLDEGTDRSMRRLSKCITRSSDSKSEGESGSPLSSNFDENASNDLKTNTHNSNDVATVSVEHDNGDTAARNSHDPPALKGQSGDSSEETHVESQDLMVVDEAIGEKGTAVSVEEQLSVPVPQVPVPQLLDIPIKEPQPKGAAVDPTPCQGRDLEAADPDPIESADEIEPQNVACLSNPDFIEAPEDVGTSFVGVIQSTPTPGVARRLKTRHGEILDDEAEQPVLLDQLSLAAPLSAKRKSRKKDMEMNNQEPMTTRKSARINPLTPATSTRAVVPCFTQKVKVTSAKTPAKRSGERSDALQNSTGDDVTRNGARTAATPSIRWATLPDPTSSPSIQPDDPSVLLDELMSSSPHLQSDRVLKRPNTRGKKVQSHTSQEGSSQEGQRLFDLTPSQIPFPYSQHKKPISTMLANEQEKEASTDSEEDQKVARKKPKLSAPYRPLSQLASQTTLYSSSLATPTTNKMVNGKANKRAAVEDSSSSSSSSEEEADESAHIPRGRKAGSVLETRRRKKSTLSKI